MGSLTSAAHKMRSTSKELSLKSKNKISRFSCKSNIKEEEEDEQSPKDQERGRQGRKKRPRRKKKTKFFKDLTEEEDNSQDSITQKKQKIARVELSVASMSEPSELGEQLKSRTQHQTPRRKASVCVDRSKTKKVTAYFGQSGQSQMDLNTPQNAYRIPTLSKKASSSMDLISGAKCLMSYEDLEWSYHDSKELPFETKAEEDSAKLECVSMSSFEDLEPKKSKRNGYLDDPKKKKYGSGQKKRCTGWLVSDERDVANHEERSDMLSFFVDSELQSDRDSSDFRESVMGEGRKFEAKYMTEHPRRFKNKFLVRR